MYRNEFYPFSSEYGIGDRVWASWIEFRYLVRGSGIWLEGQGSGLEVGDLVRRSGSGLVVGDRWSDVWVWSYCYKIFIYISCVVGILQAIDPKLFFFFFRGICKGMKGRFLCFFFEPQIPLKLGMKSIYLG